MPVDKDKMKALALAATKGPWMRLFGERTVYDRMEDGCRGNAIVRADVAFGMQDADNLDFIATANPAAVLELLAENDKLNQERDELRAEVERLKMNAERYQLMRAELSSGDLEYYRLEGGPQDDIDAYCDAQLAECAAIAAHSKAGKP